MKATNYAIDNNREINKVTERQRNFSWEHLYAEMPVEEMPWYSPVLDADLEKALNNMNIKSGTFLDLGTGPATQAMELSKRGFTVTGTDISKDAITRATKVWPTATFIQDDILHSKLNQQFNFIFDRGCFHVMNPDKRPKYVETVTELLPDRGFLFLKCFSHREPDFGIGPYRFTKEMIEQTFSRYFEILNVYDSEFQGKRKPNPKALFVIMQKRTSIKHNLNFQY